MNRVVFSFFLIPVCVCACVCVRACVCVFTKLRRLVFQISAGQH